MSALLKVLPVAALALVGYANRDALEKSLGIITKVQVAATSGIEMQGIADAVAMEYADSATLPLNNFSQFLKENMMEKGGKETRDKSRDVWGTEYRIAASREKNGFEIKSAGPDKNWNSADDLTYFYSLTGLGGKNASITAAPASEAGRAAAKKSGATTPAKHKSASTTASTASSGPPRQSPEETKRKVVASQMDRAGKGSAQAQYDLAQRYLSGDGVEADRNLALYWLQKAAEQGFAPAKSKLTTLDAGKK